MNIRIHEVNFKNLPRLFSEAGHILIARFALVMDDQKKLERQKATKTYYVPYQNFS